jgi:hypothetical protein
MFPAQTLLSDGKVDAGDAPMPAARVDVTILENNSADPTDTSGVGYLHPSYKTGVYSRDGLGSDWRTGILNPVTAHNLYAPYYSQWIPATQRDDRTYATGIDAADQALGFNGFLFTGLYNNWQFAWEYSFHPTADSKCLENQTYLPNENPRFRPLPHGISSVSVYTDEAGEANVNFVPGFGYYFDNLLANKNLNKGCDLEGVDPLGSATIETIAKYPYQPVTAGDQAADPVKFTVHNQFHKTLTVYSKGVDANGIPSNSLAKIVLAHAQDIDGSPLAHEGICWMADDDAEGFRVFSGDLPTADPKVFITLDPQGAFEDPWGIHRLCTLTDRNGNSAIEVFNSNKTSVNVIAEFVNEGILRDTFADFSLATVGATTSADGPPVSHVPSQQQLNQAVAVGATGPVVATKSAIKTIKSKQAKLTKKVLHKIRFAKVVTPFHGKAKLLVRVNGKAGLVGLRITIKKGGKSHTYTRFVPANRQITVKNLIIPIKTAKVTVKLIGL